MRKLAGGIVRNAVAATALCCLAAGCATDDIHAVRMARYRPDGTGRDWWEWNATNAVAATNGLAGGNGAEAHSEADIESRTLQRGDTVEIALLGIPEPKVLKDKLDDQGYVSLPHIGKIKLEGKTPSEAKVLIKNAYVDGKIYLRIDVSVIAEAYVYYISGEVKKPGRYKWSADMTLMRAVTAAGDFTEYARKSRIEITRGDEKKRYDGIRIEALRDEDPPIRPNDKIKVLRRWV